MNLRKPRTRESVWDLVIYTKDSLTEHRVCIDNKRGSDGKCTLGSSLVSRSHGNQVIPQLLTPVEVPFISFTKSNDDWLNEKYYKGTRQFSIEDEQIPGFEHPTLRDMLNYRKFFPEKSNIFVTGVQTNRCVMKGSIHGTYLGFNVAVIKDSVAGADAPDNWRTTGEDANAPARPCLNCNKQQLDEWKKQIFYDYHGGPESNDSIEYMREAGVTILETAQDINQYISN